jgi:C4-type Zn-finger protein
MSEATDRMKARPFPTCPDCNKDLKLSKSYVSFPQGGHFKQIYTEEWTCKLCETSQRKKYLNKAYPSQ